MQCLAVVTKSYQTKRENKWHGASGLSWDIYNTTTVTKPQGKIKEDGKWIVRARGAECLTRKLHP